MKKIITILAISCLLFLGGCSFISEVNSTVEYANEATEYIDTVQSFANEVPTLAQDAVIDEAARKNLESELLAMKEEIETFNGIEPPSIAEDLHTQIVNSNTKLVEGIDLYLANIEDGVLDPAFLEETGLLTTMTEITSLMENIQQLLN